ncbi:IclR family transcriptional regulator C-terminal domain-containing protein [Arthrobacter sp. NPDC057013]|uniref:IclR family transcriptional regulator domain-containing protein n=1 Tax=Arthrobacter sp. NPDC057013 TaxID=3345999 RepID=UPI003642C108
MTDTLHRVGHSSPRASDQYVQSLARGLDVIRAFDAEHTLMTLTEVATRAELTRASARRFLHTLVELGYVRTDRKTFALTAQVLQLGYAYLSGLVLPQLAQPHLEELSLKLGESTSAAVLDGTDVAYIARVRTPRIMTFGITLGTRFPAYATCIGRILLAGLPPAELKAYLVAAEIKPLTPHSLGTVKELLAELETIREQGWCVVDQELELGLMSVAAPVHNGPNMVAAINVSLQTPSIAAMPDSEAYLATVVQETVATAKLISADLLARR